MKIDMEYEQRRLELMRDKWLYSAELSRLLAIEKNAVNKCECAQVQASCQPRQSEKSSSVT